MIILTGAAGFIGTMVASSLNQQGRDDLILVDDFASSHKPLRDPSLKYLELVDREQLSLWIDAHHREVEHIIHLGARTDTTEFDWDIFLRLNLHFTQRLWEQCTEYQIPLIYASSAATYGAGELGYNDDHDIVEQLQPLNPYGRSKNDFDKWALNQVRKGLCPPHWYGLKFFNVYGPYEYHKGRMASVVLHTYENVLRTGHMDLFRSHRPDFKDGMQLRDFVYVKDVASVILFLCEKHPVNGLYNVGTGQAQSFLELAHATFDSMERPRDISFIDIPEDIRDKYQYFTEANISKLRKAGYDKPFHNLRSGVFDYVTNYLNKHNFN